jgi:hypothetical protein
MPTPGGRIGAANVAAVAGPPADNRTPQGHRDAVAPGRRDAGTPGHRDAGALGHWGTGTPGRWGAGTLGQSAPYAPQAASSRLSQPYHSGRPAPL